jgi:hypothetical protein
MPTYILLQNAKNDRNQSNSNPKVIHSPLKTQNSKLKAQSYEQQSGFEVIDSLVIRAFVFVEEKRVIFLDICGAVACNREPVVKVCHF